MSVKKYKLSEEPISGDVISSNIFKRRGKIYWNIKNFNSQSQNDGIFAENILRLALDGVNLNHLSKNHPHVDIAIINPIEGFAEAGEIISVKSSIKKNPTLKGLISDTKSIKLESMFSYILFANSNYELHYERDFFKPRKLLADGIKLIKDYENKDYKAVVNIATFYLMKKNKKEEFENFQTDIIRIGEGNYDLTYGRYSTNYRTAVLRRLVHLDAPISLGGLYVKETANGLTCFIHKTNPIKLNKYWEKLVNIWLDEEFFEYDSTKYLNLDLVRELFNIKEDSFPIEIQISIGTYNPESEDHSQRTEREKIEIAKKRSDKRANKLYVATKFKDADFGDSDKDVNDFFLKSIDILEKEPSLIKKFNQFTKSIENPPKLDKWW